MTALGCLINARLADGRLVDIGVTAGRITTIDRAAGAAATSDQLDLCGKLTLPGFVDGHIHLDKTLLGLPFQPHWAGSTVAERIALEKRVLRDLPIPVETRAKTLVSQVSRFGTVALRSHVDIDTDLGLVQPACAAACEGGCSQHHGHPDRGLSPKWHPA